MTIMGCTDQELAAAKVHLSSTGEDACDVTTGNAVWRLIVRGRKMKSRHDAAKALMYLSADAELEPAIRKLKTELAQVIAQRDAAKADAVRKAGELVALSADGPSALRPVDARLFEMNADALMETAIRSGRINVADARSLKALLRMQDGKPSRIGLSPSAAHGYPFEYNFWRIVAGLGEGMVSQNAIPALGADANPDGVQPSLLAEARRVLHIREPATELARKHARQQTEAPAVRSHPGSSATAITFLAADGVQPSVLAEARRILNIKEPAPLALAEELTGGRWVTINGAHVYIKDGVVVAGAPRLLGKPESLPVVKGDQLREVCFGAGTLVVMKGGQSKPIETINVGEWVMAVPDTDPTAEPRPCPVSRIFRNAPARIWQVKVSDMVIRVTANHPFYAKDRGWIAAQRLALMDRLYTIGHEWIEVEDVRDTGISEPVFNLLVETARTYFVALDDTGTTVLVHNDSGLGNPPPASQPAQDANQHIQAVKVEQPEGFKYKVTISVPKKYKDRIFAMRTVAATNFWDAKGNLIATKEQETYDLARFKEEKGEFFIVDTAQGDMKNGLNQQFVKNPKQCNSITETRSSYWRLFGDVSYVQNGVQHLWSKDNKDADVHYITRWGVPDATGAIQYEPWQVSGHSSLIVDYTPAGGVAGNPNVISLGMVDPAKVSGKITHKFDIDLSKLTTTYDVNTTGNPPDGGDVDGNHREQVEPIGIP
jgi:hypothetical protein